MKGKALAFSLVLAVQGAPAYAVNLSMVSGATGGDAQFVWRPTMQLSKAQEAADPLHVRRLNDSGAKRFTPSGVRFALAESRNGDLVVPASPGASIRPAARSFWPKMRVGRALANEMILAAVSVVTYM